MRVFWLSLLALSAVSSTGRADPIDDIVRDQMEASRLPAVAVAVVDRGHVTKLSGYGQANLEWSQPADADTRFQLASATKLFTAILLMRLVEQGRLSLDDPIASFFPQAPAAWSRITVRQLANHSSGLSEDLGQPAPTTVDEAVAASMRQPLAYEPGTEARYGFTDFTILRAILEKTGGAPLPALLEREIAEQLGLTCTAFPAAADDGDVRTSDVLPRRASIYGWNGERQRNSEFFFSPLGYGAGGLFSCARDLATLFAALDDGRLLKRESLEEIMTPVLLKSGETAGFGIGWTVRSYRGVPVVGHSGGPALADILHIPSVGRTIVVLTNQRTFYPVLAEQIADLSLPEPATATLADDRPEVARNVLGLFTAIPAGADTGPYVAGERKPDEMLRSGFGRALVDAVGPIRHAGLVRVDPNGARTYRLRFARKVMDFTFEHDGQGRITDLRPAG